MTFYERPVLNSPYTAPTRHWELEADGPPTDRIVERARGMRHGHVLGIRLTDLGLRESLPARVPRRARRSTRPLNVKRRTALSLRRPPARFRLCECGQAAVEEIGRAHV